MGPEISVILAAYRSAETLPACLDSLRGNLADFAEDDIEAVVPYREANDGSLDILRRFDLPGLKIVSQPHEDPPGVQAAHNLGVEHARGRFGVFLNSDDELGPHFLRTMLDIALTRDPERHVVYSSVLFIDRGGEPLFWRHPPPYCGWIQRYYSIVLHPNAIYPMGLLKRHRFDVVPGTPMDRQQVYRLMKDAVWSRTRRAHYRFRLWSLSDGIQAAERKLVLPEERTLRACLARAIGRIYVQSYETNLVRRLFAGRFGRNSYWRGSG